MSLSIIVKWAGKEYNIQDIDPGESVMDLKVKIMGQTGVRLRDKNSSISNLRGKLQRMI